MTCMPGQDNYNSSVSKHCIALMPAKAQSSSHAKECNMLAVSHALTLTAGTVQQHVFVKSKLDSYHGTTDYTAHNHRYTEFS